MGDPAATPTPRLSKAARRDQLLDVAAELAVEDGVDAVTMEGVAARAGVSKALPYKFFTNREDLLLALYEREIEEVATRMNAATTTVDDFADRVRATVQSWLDTIAERGLLIGILMNTPLLSGRIEERSAQLGVDLTREWATFIEAEYGLDPAVAVDAAAVMVSGSQGLLPRWLQDRRPRGELIDAYVAMCMGGLEELTARSSRAPGDR